MQETDYYAQIYHQLFAQRLYMYYTKLLQVSATYPGHLGSYQFGQCVLCKLSVICSFLG
jgi:hypothetical protein